MQSSAYIVYFFDDEYTKIIEGVFLSKDKAEAYIREANEFNNMPKLGLQEIPLYN